MYELIFYEDSHGRKPVLDFIRELESTSGKDSRVRLKKVLEYMRVLRAYGVAAGEPYIKHLEKDIWELRPTGDRILFAGVVGGRFVLLHTFRKQTQKTPRREIDKAISELKDFTERSGLK